MSEVSTFEIVDMIRNGVNRADIAAHYNVAREVITRRVYRARLRGLLPHVTGRISTREVADMIKAGIDRDRIAAHFDVEPHRVTKAISIARSKGWLPRAPVQRAYTMRNVTVGSLRSQVMRDLTDEEFKWMVSQIRGNTRTLSALVVKLIRDAAALDAKGDA